MVLASIAFMGLLLCNGKQLQVTDGGSETGIRGTERLLRQKDFD